MLELIEATEADVPVLDNLSQYYVYDFSEIDGWDVPETGRFPGIPRERWTEAGRQAFIAMVDGAIAGFALVSRRSMLTGDADVTDMNEFFVMRRYRRRGVGAEMARRLFDMFPGRWEVREIPPNASAQAFWRRVIGEYTGGRFEERTLDGEGWRGVVQSFETPRA